MSHDKQLGGIRLEDVLEKRRLDQALNAKEFAVLAGISYSTAREWFRIHGFPVFRGVVFWKDFVRWRMTQNHSEKSSEHESFDTSNLPPQAARLLSEV